MKAALFRSSKSERLERLSETADAAVASMIPMLPTRALDQPFGFLAQHDRERILKPVAMIRQSRCPRGFKEAAGAHALRIHDNEPTCALVPPEASGHFVVARINRPVRIGKPGKNAEVAAALQVRRDEQNGAHRRRRVALNGLNRAVEFGFEQIERFQRGLATFVSHEVCVARVKHMRRHT